MLFMHTPQLSIYEIRCSSVRPVMYYLREPFLCIT